MKWNRKGFVESQPGREQTVVSVDICRAPVISERRIQTFCSIGIDTPDGLACHKVQKVVSRLRFSCLCFKCSRIVGCAELIESGIPLASLDVIERSNRRCRFAWSKSNL